VQPSTATRPSEASMPTMTCSPYRSQTRPRNAGSSAARVPTMAQRAPASSTASTWASSRSPPPTCTGIRTAAIMARTSSVWAGRPAKAPSRSTTWRRRARESCQRRATATGSSEKTVSASARPCRSRTHRPPFKSTAGTISNIELPTIPSALHGLLGSPSAAPRQTRSCSSRLADDGGEVLEHADAPALALLGVELGGVERPARDRRREREPVRAGRHPERGVGGLRIVGVHEVEVRAARDAVEDLQISPVLDLVPAHVRHLEAGGEAAHRARDDVEPLALAELLALREEELVAEADPEERPLALEAGAQRRDQSQRLEAAHRDRKSVVARQHHRLRVVDHLRVLGDDRRHADPREGLLHAAEIAAPVINDCDHVFWFAPVLPEASLSQSVCGEDTRLRLGLFGPLALIGASRRPVLSM